MASIRKKDIQHRLEKIKEDEQMLSENKKLILEFQRYLKLKDYSNRRQYKYLIKLPKMAKQLNKPFDEANRKDIEKVVLWIKNRNDISETTKLDYKIIFKRFYKWIGDGEYPECVKFINTTKKHNNDKLPEEMLTKKDIRKLLEAASHPRNKALIAMLWETGARIGELIDLQIGSLEDHKHGMKCVVNGKTGARRLMLLESVPYINDWVKTHPQSRKDAPLWVNVGTRNNGEAMEYRAILKMLNDTAKKAGIDKPVNPHQFRHSRATYMANHFTEAQMCEWFGWVQGSDVPARYVHLSGRDIDDAYERMHGLQQPEEEEEDIGMEPQECPRCGYENGAAMKYCGKCGMALDMDAAMEAEDIGKEIVEALQDPETGRKILKALESVQEEG